MNDRTMAITLGLLVASMLPIWRCAGGWRGMSFWEYTKYAMLDPDGVPHVPVGQAVSNARQAYCNVMGCNVEGSTYRRGDTFFAPII